MAVYNGAQYTDFQNINLKGSGTGTTPTSVGFPNFPGALRIKFNGFVTTVSISSTTLDQPFAVMFPNKSGTMPISGTFAVNLPAVAATTSVFSTIVTVAGIRAEDGLTVTQSNQGVTAGYATDTTAKIFYQATPGNGNITLRFVNLGAATGYTESTFTFTAVR